MNEGIHLDLDTWIVPGQIRKANLCPLNNPFIHTEINTPFIHTEINNPCINTEKPSIIIIKYRNK